MTGQCPCARVWGEWGAPSGERGGAAEGAESARAGVAQAGSADAGAGETSGVVCVPRELPERGA